MADSKSGLRKPVFTKVDQLRPGTSGHTLTVKVVNAKMVMQKGRSDGPQSRQMRIAECLVGDETGMIIFTARNDQGIYVLLLFPKLYIFKFFLTTSWYFYCCHCLFFGWAKGCYLVVLHGIIACIVSSVLFCPFCGGLPYLFRCQLALDFHLSIDMHQVLYFVKFM